MGFPISQFKAPTVAGLQLLGPIVASSSDTTGQQSITTTNQQIQQIFISRLVEITCGFQYMGGVNAEGRPDGEGIARYSDGEVYIGSFRDGERHGYGKYLYSEENDLKEYIGHFKEGYLSNQGSIEFRNGDRLSVYTSDYQIEGTLIRSNGDIFAGCFAQGSLCFTSGSIIYKALNETFIGEVKLRSHHSPSLEHYTNLWNFYDVVGPLSISTDGGKTVYHKDLTKDLYKREQKQASLVEILIHALHSGMYSPKATT